MVFSFFVAVVLTPWLMLKAASSRAAVAHAHEAAGGGRLGALYVRVAEPLLRTRARAWTFLLAVGRGDAGVTLRLLHRACPR